jgi:hypothetical protein
MKIVMASTTRVEGYILPGGQVFVEPGEEGFHFLTLVTLLILGEAIQRLASPM